MVMELSLTKNVERKEKEHMQGRINRRKPVLDPTIQFAVSNPYTTYQFRASYGCGDSVDKKCRKKEKDNKSCHQTA